MNQSVEKMQFLRNPPPSAQRGGRVWKAILKIGSSLIPWLVIGGLLWAGLFIKPKPVGATVRPPVMERRDYYFGVAQIPGKGFWLAGSSGKIVAIENDGHGARFDSTTEQTLQDIAVWDSERGVAVGNDGVVVITTDGGKKWHQVADVPKSLVANKLNRVRVVAGGLAIATGEMGAILMSRDYGEHWVRLRLEEDQAWNDVAFLPSGKVLAVGEFGRIVLSSDDGRHWENIKSPVKSSLTSVAFSDARTGVAVGLEGVVLMTRDGGKTWKRLDVKVSDHLFGIAWDGVAKRWVGCGGLGSWITVSGDGIKLNAGRLNERDLSWHTSVVPIDNSVWFAGANVGLWDGANWHPLDASQQSTSPQILPLNKDKFQ